VTLETRDSVTKVKGAMGSVDEEGVSNEGWESANEVVYVVI
jgi:hypothetical protein